MAASPLSAEQLTTKLRALCAIPSIAGRTGDMALAAEKVVAFMRTCSLQTQLIDQDGVPPLVIGYRAGRAPTTLLLYHHYDVAPSGPWRAWRSEPFDLAERDEILFGRGVSLGKGPLVAHLCALQELLATNGELPCGVLVLAEGQGLSGSAGLAAALPYLPHHHDACLASAGEGDAGGLPFCYGGAKGLLQVTLTTSGGPQPLPAGLAASVANPLWRLVWALSSIKTADEALQVEGIEAGVAPLHRDEGQIMRQAAPADEQRLAAWQIAQFLFEMHGPPLLRTEAALPTCNIAQISSEPAGEFVGIPISASARLDFHLVPQQQPSAVAAALQAHIAGIGIGEIAITPLSGGYSAARTPLAHPFVQHVATCGEQAYGKRLPLLPLGYFALPLAMLSDQGRLPVASVGCPPVDTGSVGANESVAVERLLRHGTMLIELLHGMEGLLPV